jgi:hypothetical protein
MKPDVVPEQKEGKQNDLYAEAEFATEEKAVQRYHVARTKLLSPDTWQATAGFISAEFKLFDKDGKALEGGAAPGDLIRIDLLGPGPASGDGYDWVTIEDIKETNEAGKLSIAMRVSPVAEPGKNGEAAHFFTSHASSVFIITRQGKFVRASYHGRNEVTNNDTGNYLDDLRNTLVGLGAKAGFSEMQWQALLKGFVN